MDRMLFLNGLDVNKWLAKGNAEHQDSSSFGVHRLSHP